MSIKNIFRNGCVLRMGLEGVLSSVWQTDMGPRLMDELLNEKIKRKGEKQGSSDERKEVERR